MLETTTDALPRNCTPEGIIQRPNSPVPQVSAGEGGVTSRRTPYLPTRTQGCKEILHSIYKPHLAQFGMLVIFGSGEGPITGRMARCTGKMRVRFLANAAAFEKAAAARYFPKPAYAQLLGWGNVANVTILASTWLTPYLPTRTQGYKEILHSIYKPHKGPFGMFVIWPCRRATG
eukprot:350499-Chlamydomonas_euryale.AAC.16